MKLAALVLLLLAAMALSLTVGVREIAPAEYLSALTSYDPYDPAHVTLLSIRLPRAPRRG